MSDCGDGPNATKRTTHHGPTSFVVGARSYDVSPDGRLLMIKNLDVGVQPSFVLVQNCLAEVADCLRPR